MQFPYDLISTIIGVFLFADATRIQDFFETRRQMIAPFVGLIITFVSLGTTIEGLPSVLISSHVNAYWFFVPFGWMTFRFIQNSIRDFNRINGRQFRAFYLIPFATGCTILTFIALAVFVLAPFANMMH